jgi:hypothetical protein
MRGGSYAILMAFHHSATKTLSKAQICQLAQPYCDEEMEANFHAGRMHGAWSSHKTLCTHNLLTKEGDNRRYVPNVGFRSNGPARLTLTRDGEQFTEAMLRKFHGGAVKGETIVAARTHIVNPFEILDGVPSLVASHTPLRRAKTNLMDADEMALREWILTAGVNEQKSFDVGKDRRLQLHSLCDTLEQENPGLKLHHTSVGGGRGRTLFITVVQKSQFTVEGKSPVKRAFGGTGFKLEAQTPEKKIRPAEAAGAAALERAAIEESKRMAKAAPRELVSIDTKDSAAWRKVPPVAAARRNLCDDFDILDHLEESNDHTDHRIRPPLPFAMKNPVYYDLSNESLDCTPRSHSTRLKDAPEILDLCCDEPPSKRHVQDVTEVVVIDSDDEEIPAPPIKQVLNPYKVAKPPGDERSQLTFCIDDRERIRNAAPRHLRTELARLLTTGCLKAVWPENLQESPVDEVKLRFGDFSFIVGGKRLDVAVERKQIRDLVQRSARGDHWKQLGKMRDNFRHAVFLIEVDPRQAARFDAHGSQKLEGWNPYNTVIDDEKSFYLFMCRALLSHRSIKFIQTGNFQSSLRAVGALGLMAACLELAIQHDPEHRTLPVVDEQTQLFTRLTTAGLPLPLADQVAKEYCSVTHLESRYQECVDEDCKRKLLLPLVQNTDMEGFASGAESSWTEAIFRSLYSVHADTSVAANAYQSFKPLVTDHGDLCRALHTNIDTDMALDSVLSSTTIVEDEPRRHVNITVCEDQAGLLPAPTKESFFSLNITTKQPLGTSVPTLVFRTSAGSLTSPDIIVHTVSGPFFVEEVKAVMLRIGSDHVKTARLAGASIMKACKGVGTKKARCRKILIIRGLSSAIEAEAKKAGYRAELKTLLDLVTADLMLEHDVVVIQALRQSGDVELILQQLALACFHYQLLTDKAPDFLSLA